MDATLAQILSYMFRLQMELEQLKTDYTRLQTENAELKKAPA